MFCPKIAQKIFWRNKTWYFSVFSIWGLLWKPMIGQWLESKSVVGKRCEFYTLVKHEATSYGKNPQAWSPAWRWSTERQRHVLRPLAIKRIIVHSNHFSAVSIHHDEIPKSLSRSRNKRKTPTSLPSHPHLQKEAATIQKRDATAAKHNVKTRSGEETIGAQMNVRFNFS